MSEPRFRGDRLSQLMDRRKLNAGQVEYMSGVSQSMIWNLQHGKRPNVSAVIVAKLAEVLECEIEYLLNLTADVVGEERAAYSTGSPLEEGQRAILEFFESLSEDEQAFVLELVAFVRQRNTPGCDEAKRRRGEDGGFVGTDG